MRFYLNKIGEHLQELAVLAIVFVPLDRKLTMHQIAVLCAICGAVLLCGIEVERRYQSMMAAYGAYGYILTAALAVGVIGLIISEVDKRRRPH